ncbi:MAG: hypothetical protein BGN97_05145 [Microbacterium sp. 69-10]|nr:MAG: hypothetical protein BGN97_05145 [Microbacterium sp. 69-10]
MPRRSLTTEYVRNGTDLADLLEGMRKNTVGVAPTVLQPRLASSPEAIFQLLRRRTDQLEHPRAELLDAYGISGGDQTPMRARLLLPVSTAPSSGAVVCGAVLLRRRSAI